MDTRDDLVGEIGRGTEAGDVAVGLAVGDKIEPGVDTLGDDVRA